VAFIGFPSTSETGSTVSDAVNTETADCLFNIFSGFEYPKHERSLNPEVSKFQVYNDIVFIAKNLGTILPSQTT